MHSKLILLKIIKDKTDANKELRCLSAVCLLPCSEVCLCLTSASAVSTQLGVKAAAVSLALLFLLCEAANCQSVTETRQWEPVTFIT